VSCCFASDIPEGSAGGNGARLTPDESGMPRRCATTGGRLQLQVRGCPRFKQFAFGSAASGL